MGQIAERKAEVDEDRRKLRTAPKFAPAGQSTQMVIGATPSTDRDIIQRASALYGEYKLRRVYYTGFSPYPEADTRLPLQATPRMREHRLYQADWLMRFYGFNADEITTDSAPELDLAIDPKLAWARRHPEFFPVDVNAAPREALLRVPGLGYHNVDRIVRIRRYHKLSLEDLRKLHVRMKDTAEFVVTTDHLPLSTLPFSAEQSEREMADTARLVTEVAPPIAGVVAAQQLDLFANAAQSAATGVL
jgi:predicted DNA-binding helix-hairpin-helix protein